MVSNRPEDDPAGSARSTPAEADHNEARSPLARFTGGLGQPRAASGQRLGRLALFLGALAVVTSIAIVGGVIGVAAIAVGIRARGRARRGEGGGGTGTAGLALGALSLLIAFTVASGMWVFYQRHGDDLKRLQDCQRDARSAAAREDCSRRFSEAFRTDPASNG